MADFYKYPADTLTLLRREMDLHITLESEGRVGLFLYNNNTFIVQSFLERPERVRICINKAGASISSLLHPQVGKMRPPEKSRSRENESVFDIYLMPGRYAAFRINED
jgi:hypothetical protein